LKAGVVPLNQCSGFSQKFNGGRGRAKATRQEEIGKIQSKN